MSSIKDNKDYYLKYDWSKGGAEWSHYWGSLDALWEHSLHPRIKAYLPAGTVLEVGAGCGRISSKLRQHATEKMILTDIIPHCVNTCRMLFHDDYSVVSLMSDGSNLHGVDDNSVDFILSFYSLVDSDCETMQSYCHEINRVLTSKGTAFIHHSNAAAYCSENQSNNNPSLKLLAAYRDISMSADVLQSLANEAELTVTQQECINWDIEEVLSDCFSTLVKTDEHLNDQVKKIQNHSFCAEMRLAKENKAIQK
ncbi:MAG: ubiquinone/menaquinone biosynthesis C-methylase UbiE [Gammaproteobacteria bacterium]|jgi:ubiquinone/menaquinone biosynthesis C-methylase UbiE